MSIHLANISEASGFSLALMGMAVVFFALSLVSGFIALLPRVLGALEHRFPETMAPGAQATVTLASRSAADEALVAAVVASVVHHRPRPMDTE